MDIVKAVKEMRENADVFNEKLDNIEALINTLDDRTRNIQKSLNILNDKADRILISQKETKTKDE